MKKLFVCVLMLVISVHICSAQSDVIEYTEVVTVDSANQKELYKRAVNFFAVSFNSSKDVLQIQDPENGVLFGKGILTKKVPYVWGIVKTELDVKIKFNIRISVKDGKYKFEFTDFDNYNIYPGYYFGPVTTNPKPPVEWKTISYKRTKDLWGEVKGVLYDEMNSTVAMLKKHMSTTEDAW
jgi:hypothetical protein